MRYIMKVQCQAPLVRGQRVKYDSQDGSFKRVTSSSGTDILESIFIAEEDVTSDRRAKISAPSEPMTFYYADYPFLQNMNNGLIFANPNANILGWSTDVVSIFNSIAVDDGSESFGYLIKVDEAKCQVFFTNREVWRKS